MFLLTLEIRRMFLNLSSWIFNVYFLENHQALCRLERGRMRRGRSLTQQAPPPPHNVPASLNRVGSRNGAALHLFPGTLQTPPNTLKKSNGMTRLWAFERLWRRTTRRVEFVSPKRMEIFWEYSFLSSSSLVPWTQTTKGRRVGHHLKWIRSF